MKFSNKNKFEVKCFFGRSTASLMVGKEESNDTNKLNCRFGWHNSWPSLRHLVVAQYPYRISYADSDLYRIPSRMLTCDLVRGGRVREKSSTASHTRAHAPLHHVTLCLNPFPSTTQTYHLPAFQLVYNQAASAGEDCKLNVGELNIRSTRTY